MFAEKFIKKINALSFGFGVISQAVKPMKQIQLIQLPGIIICLKNKGPNAPAEIKYLLS